MMMHVTRGWIATNSIVAYNHSMVEIGRWWACESIRSNK